MLQKAFKPLKIALSSKPYQFERIIYMKNVVEVMRNLTTPKPFDTKIWFGSGTPIFADELLRTRHLRIAIGKKLFIGQN